MLWLLLLLLNHTIQRAALESTQPASDACCCSGQHLATTLAAPKQAPA
jgi:hypothetical protein